MCTHKCARVWKPRVHLGDHSSGVFILIFETGSLSGMQGSLSRLDYVASDPGDLLVKASMLRTAGNLSAQCHAQLFM